MEIGDWRLDKMRKVLLLLLVACCLLLPLGLVGLAQGGYDLSWWTVDGGGQMYSIGGGYELMAGTRRINGRTGWPMPRPARLQG